MTKREIITLIVESEDGADAYRSSGVIPINETRETMTLLLCGDSLKLISHDIHPHDTDPSIAREVDEENLPCEDCLDIGYLRHKTRELFTACRECNTDNHIPFDGKLTPLRIEESKRIDCGEHCQVEDCDGPDSDHLSEEMRRVVQCKCGHKFNLGWRTCPMCEADNDPVFMDKDHHEAGLTAEEKILEHTGRIMDKVFDIMTLAGKS